jgi:UDP-N-acetylmuramoyl-L-alanyl-D-glutamate--2,6-diaminopimelate ligase
MTLTLDELLKTCPVEKIHGKTALEVRGLHYDSRQVTPQSAFFALRGLISDGHNYIPSAVANGASVIVCEQRPVEWPPVTVVLVQHTRQAMAMMASAFYGDPTSDMKTVGITGTNGKTTITYLLESVLEQAKMAPAVIGTINYRFGNTLRQAPHTTPEALDLMKQVHDFRDNGAKTLIMEVSSHALDQHRVDGVHFDVGVFTNLTPEHLDYYRDIESYFDSKYHLFKELLPESGGQAVINIDDLYGQRLAQMAPKAITCSSRQAAHICPEQVDISLNGIRGKIKTPQGLLNLQSPLLGAYNLENLLSAIGASLALGIPLDAIEEGLANASGVPGRLEQIENDRGAIILVDYAHTGDALKKVIDAMQQLQPSRILTVFGCGGDRDRQKRPVMAETVARGSDIAIATSDNPRTEDPQQILDDIRVGLHRVHQTEWSREEARQSRGKGYAVIEDRREAICFAVSLLRQKDLLLVAGKGHEDYQILATGRIHFDDREEVRAALQAGGGQ